MPLRIIIVFHVTNVVLTWSTLGSREVMQEPASATDRPLAPQPRTLRWNNYRIFLVGRFTTL